MILIVRSGNHSLRLCQDDKWRHFANFGTFPECVKEYKRLSSAIKKAKRFCGIVIQLPQPTPLSIMEVDACGGIVEHFNNGNTVNHNLMEFAIVPP